MLIKWGAFVTEGRGKVGGTVASKNRAGAYFRNKVTPVNPNTTAQQLARANLTAFSQGWSGLSEVQRDAWNSATENWMKTNIFGDSVKPTGKNLYTRLNINITNSGGSPIVAPPVPQGLAEMVLTGWGINPTTTDYDLDVLNLEENAEVFIWATSPQSPGKSFVKSEYRLLGTHTVAAQEATAGFIPVAKTMYSSVFGDPIADMKVFFAIQPVSSATGETGTRSGVGKIYVPA